MITRFGDDLVKIRNGIACDRDNSMDMPPNIRSEIRLFSVSTLDNARNSCACATLAQSTNKIVINCIIFVLRNIAAFFYCHTKLKTDCNYLFPNLSRKQTDGLSPSLIRFAGCVSCDRPLEIPRQSPPMIHQQAIWPNEQLYCAIVTRTAPISDLDKVAGENRDETRVQ